MSERVANIEPRNSGYIADIDSGMSGLIQIGEERRVRVRERLDINPGSDEDVPGLCLDDYKSKPGFIGMMMGGFGKIAQGVKQVADCYRKRRRTKNADKIKLKLMCCLPEFDCHTVVKFPVRFREGNGPADGTDWDHGVLTVGPIPKHKAARYSIIFPPTQVDLATTTDQSIGVYVLIPSQFITLKTGKKSSRHYDYYNWKFVHKQTLGSPNWEQATWNIRFEHAWEELCLHACAATLLPQTYSEAMKEALFLLRCELMQDVGPVLEQFMLKYEQELAARRARASEMLYGASLLNISRYFACGPSLSPNYMRSNGIIERPRSEVEVMYPLPTVDDNVYIRSESPLDLGILWFDEVDFLDDNRVEILAVPIELESGMLRQAGRNISILTLPHLPLEQNAQEGFLDVGDI